MSNSTLIIGNSGCGKSTSIRNLKPEETFIIQVQRKRLPFKHSPSDYFEFMQDDNDNWVGNIFVSESFSKILKMLDYVSEKMPHIKTLIIDDFQYIMAKEYINRATESGWQKFTEITQHAFVIVDRCSQLRPDLDIFILTHSEFNEASNIWKTKTIGKMFDEKIGIEAMHTIVLHTVIIDGKYRFLTNQKDKFLAKSPIDMFEDLYIDNDLQLVKDSMEKYWSF